MAPELLCQQVLEELLSHRTPTGAMAVHLATCPICIQAQQTLEGLKTLPSAWPAAPSAGLQQKIMKSVADAGLLKPVSPPPSTPTLDPKLPGNAPAGSLTAGSLAAALGGGVILLGLMISLSNSHPAERSGETPKTAQIATHAIMLPAATASAATQKIASTTASPSHQLISDPESDRR